MVITPQILMGIRSFYKNFTIWLPILYGSGGFTKTQNYVQIFLFTIGIPKYIRQENNNIKQEDNGNSSPNNADGLKVGEDYKTNTLSTWFKPWPY